MPRTESPPFDRGESDTNVSKYAGFEYDIEDNEWGSSAPNRRSGHRVRVRLVKNSSGIALLPKRLVTFKAGTNRTEVDGYVTLTAAIGYPVDEFLPSGGVANGDYFFIVVGGPALVLTGIASSALNLIPENSVVVGLTAATSQATTAGRGKVRDMTGAAAVLGAEVAGGLGHAMSAKTAANTDADLLLFISTRWD